MDEKDPLPVPANENLSPEQQAEADAYFAAFAEALAAHTEMEALQELYGRALGKLEGYLAGPAVGGQAARALLLEAERLFAEFSKARDATDPFVIDEPFFALGARLTALKEKVDALPR
jgi:hypothetical protein